MPLKTNQYPLDGNIIALRLRKGVTAKSATGCAKGAKKKTTNLTPCRV